MASVCFPGTISFSWMLMSCHQYFPAPSCETFLLKCLILQRQKPHCPPQIKWAKNKPQRSHVTSTIENVHCEHHRRHSPTWVCGRNSNQRQDFQGEAGWPRNVLWFASQVSLFQLSEGKRRKLDTAGGKSPDKIGLHPTEGVLFFITGMQCFLGGLGKSSTESTELIKSPVCVITQWL